MKFECQKCGNCCKLKRINISYVDVLRWQKLGRTDILRKIVFGMQPDKTGQFYVGDSLFGQCSFLGDENLCTIYQVRPQTCRDFPFTHTDAPENCPAWNGYRPSKRLIEKAKRESRRTEMYSGKIFNVIKEARDEIQSRHSRVGAR